MAMGLSTLPGREPRSEHEQRLAAGETLRHRNWFSAPRRDFHLRWRQPPDSETITAYPQMIQGPFRFRASPTACRPWQSHLGIAGAVSSSAWAGDVTGRRFSSAVNGERIFRSSRLRRFFPC